MLGMLLYLKTFHLLGWPLTRLHVDQANWVSLKPVRYTSVWCGIGINLLVCENNLRPVISSSAPAVDRCQILSLNGYVDTTTASTSFAHLQLATTTTMWRCGPSACPREVSVPGIGVVLQVLHLHKFSLLSCPLESDMLSWGDSWWEGKGWLLIQSTIVCEMHRLALCLEM